MVNIWAFDLNWKGLWSVISWKAPFPYIGFVYLGLAFFLFLLCLVSCCLCLFHSWLALQNVTTYEVISYQRSSTLYLVSTVKSSPLYSTNISTFSSSSSSSSQLSSSSSSMSYDSTSNTVNSLDPVSKPFNPLRAYNEGIFWNCISFCLGHLKEEWVHISSNHSSV